MRAARVQQATLFGKERRDLLEDFPVARSLLHRLPRARHLRQLEREAADQRPRRIVQLDRGRTLVLQHRA